MPLTASQTAASYDPTVAREPSAEGSPRQSIAGRFAERFALIAFGLYHVPLFVNNYPSLGGGGFNDTGLAPQWGRIFTIPSIWVAKHVLGIANPGGATGDNGDTSEEYARLLIAVVAGLIGATVWTLRDRKHPRGEWVESTVRVLLRFSIALGLMSYGIAKILPQQFPPIGTGTLDSRVGSLSPMSLLWTFMQYSRPYAFFGGVMEMAAVVLLCFRRTALLGALVCVAVMSNVAFMNFAYGVPVKLYATMTMVSAMVLVLYDARRLIDLFVRDRAVPASNESTWLQDRVPRGARWTIKGLATVSVAVSSVIAMPLSTPRAESPLYGTWAVSSGNTEWRRVTIDGGRVLFRFTGDSSIICRRTIDAAAVALTCGRNHRGELRWSREANRLRLEGTFDGAAVNAEASFVDRDSYPLMRARFRWIFD